VLPSRTAREPGGAGSGPGDWPRDVDDPRRLDDRLVALCRERGPLRVVLARLAAGLVEIRAWERLGFARLSDYAVECLGLSGRSVQSLARVGAKLRRAPRLQNALVTGALGWTKVRLLAQLPDEEDLGRWIEYAGGVTADRLAKEVRAVDRAAIEAGALDDAEPSRLFEVRCTPEVRWKWAAARGAASRAAGGSLSTAKAAELVAAEVLSALPIDQESEDEPCQEEGVSWSSATEAADDAARDTSVRDDGRDTGVKRAPWRERAGDAGRVATEAPRTRLPQPLESLLDGIGEADAFELDERFRRAHEMERRLDARVGPLLVRVWERWAHRALGYATREAYARERLGMDPTRARALVRLERTAGVSPAFASAVRSGVLSCVKASALEPLVFADPLGRFVEQWIDWAGRITVRRLRDDVERALALWETDLPAFRQDGGLPSDAREEREIRATPKGAERIVAQADRVLPWVVSEEADSLGRIQAPPKSAPLETCWARFIGPAETVHLLRAVLSTVRRRLERETGRLPTAGEALGVMLDHALSSWGELDAKVRASHAVFARDGWRCAAPGCSSMQNLHDHHIRFRSAGGTDELTNRVTLCACHHLRGVHAGLLRCAGQAPEGLRWELGIRSGAAPRLVYRSGDVRVGAMARL